MPTPSSSSAHRESSVSLPVPAIGDNASSTPHRRQQAKPAPPARDAGSSQSAAANLQHPSGTPQAPPAAPSRRSGGGPSASTPTRQMELMSLETSESHSPHEQSAIAPTHQAQLPPFLPSSSELVNVSNPSQLALTTLTFRHSGTASSLVAAATRPEVTAATGPLG